MRKTSLKTKDYTYIGIFAVLLCISAWISIPSIPPFTMQTFAVSLCAGVLGAKKGTLAVAIYLLLGIVGLPVYSGFMSGVGVLLGATGGYLLGFLPFCGLSGYLFQKAHSPICKVLSLLAGLFVCYATGTLYYAIFYQSSGGIVSSITLCVLPFIIPDIIKITLAEFCIKALKRHIFS